MLIMGIIIPFLGTMLGSLMVFFINNTNDNIMKKLLSFASGVMLAASFWSLIVPSIEMYKGNKYFSWIPASIGFILGVLFLIVSNKIVLKINKQKNTNSSFKKIGLMVFAITLHNIPEGMAVGVNFASVLNKNTNVTLISAFVLAIGIAIQNIPEGAIISMPLKSEKTSKFRSFICGTLSGIVEPIFALLTLLLSKFIGNILPCLLSFAAGAMIYVVVSELIPEFNLNKNNDKPILFFSLGFIIMMILDVALG